MAYVYMITNKINQKKYIGKTNFSIEKRWKEHQRDSLRNRCEKRPLYNAINRYKTENFIIEKLEECSPDIAEQREQYWIEQLDTYNNGYNATIGGDGKSFLNYKQILKLFDETLLTQSEIAKECNCSESSVKNIVSQYRENVNWLERYTSRQLPNNLGISGKAVRCIEEQMEFCSATKAASWLVESGKITSQSYGRAKIPMACRGERNTVGSYHWEYI